MPWRYMTLRGNRVLARCDESGALIAEKGRVEIRYNPTDKKAYRASKGNLVEAGDKAVLPDSHCAEAQASPSRDRVSTVKLDLKKQAFHPEKPSADEIIAYADGACSGNPGPAGLGVVMLWDEERRELSEYLGHGTNNIAELTAIARVLDAVNEIKRPLRIFTDSNYSIGVLTRGWKVKANQELVASVKLGLSRFKDVEFIHVRGHAGIPLNERADELAREAVETKDSPGWKDVV